MCLLALTLLLLAAGLGFMFIPFLFFFFYFIVCWSMSGIVNTTLCQRELVAWLLFELVACELSEEQYRI